MAKRYILLGVVIMVAAITCIFVWQKKVEKRQLNIVDNRGNYAAKSIPENPVTQREKSVQLATPNTEPNTKDNEFIFPADELERIVASISEEANAHIDLAVFEADLRASLAKGWTPPWQNLAPKLTREECVKMPTLKLAEACFSSSIFARELLLFEKPAMAFSRLKILYPCYGELFKRDDLWEGILSAYFLYTSHLDPKGEPNAVIDSLMGLDNLPRIFQLPNMQEQLKGRELLFVHGQLEAIKGIRSYIEGDANEALVSATPFFSTTTPISLVNLTLAFMQKASITQSSSAIGTISELRLPKKPKMGEVKNYMDVSITEIERFLNSYQE